MVLICTKFRENMLNDFSYGVDTISILIISKGHNSVKMYIELQFLFSAHRLIMIYICTKCRRNILNSFRVMEWTRFVTDIQTVTDGQTDR